VKDFPLDAGVDIQTITDDITLTPISEPEVIKNRLHWSGMDRTNYIGYSIYLGDERLNERVITDNAYQTSVECDVRFVIRGGHETVYGSQGSQMGSDDHAPLSYAFTIFPNPFVQQTRIEYAIPEQTVVDIAIFDATGRKVKTVKSGAHRPGYYRAIWHGIDDCGRNVSCGIYFVQFESETYRKQDKVLLIR
jgi:hypothetical protein